MTNQKHRGPVSDHFDGVRFFVPGFDGDKTRFDLLRWTFGERRARWPKSVASPHGDKPPSRVGLAEIRSTLIGHASFLLQVAGLNILIDPVYGDRASPVGFAGPKRVNPPGVAFDDLPRIDAVLLTHNHYDHFDKRFLWKLEAQYGPQFIGPLGTDHDIGRSGRVPSRLKVLDWGQHMDLGAVQVHAVPTYHWSARGLADRRASLWCSFVMTSAAGTVYHIGDTGYGAGAFSKDVAQDFGKIQLAHIPIGAYAPRWFMKDHHINPEEAVQVLQDCNARFAIGHHWGTFQLTNEAHDEPEQHLGLAMATAGIAQDRFTAFRPGQFWSSRAEF
jgi:L-ascorbate metabolism protein UlaG (beta-lactamase superfamily)